MTDNPPENIRWTPDRWDNQQLDSPFGARKVAVDPVKIRFEEGY